MAKEKFTFRVLAGTHTDERGKVYKKGESIDSDIELDKRFKFKFDRIRGQAEASPSIQSTVTIEKEGRKFRVVDADGDSVHDGLLTKRQADTLKGDIDSGKVKLGDEIELTSEEEEANG